MNPPMSKKTKFLNTVASVVKRPADRKHINEMIARGASFELAIDYAVSMAWEVERQQVREKLEAAIL